MDRVSRIDSSVLDNIIIGRVEPHIYAFSTETVPNYLKVGDTSRSVKIRLDEWRKIFPNLIQQYEHSAQIDADNYFRDYAVHNFLEYEKGRERLLPHTFKNLPYYSREFFKDATPKDVEEAIGDIIRHARENSGKYPLYAPDRLPKTMTYARNENFAPRDNQQQAIDNFKTALENGRTNLLLYAVMRFGKSFTSMCCAREINARMVVIVSAKADVKEEWKKTVESHINFEAYHFFDSNDLKRDESVIENTLIDPHKKVVVFLTLQDLQGTKVKQKHKEIFNQRIDLLIIDETHFGARGESYGKVLQEQRLNQKEIKRELKDPDGYKSLDEVDVAVKSLDSKIKLHLSGTPYRILMSDEFQKDDVIAFVQFSDIMDAQKDWNEKYLKEDEVEEWDNPYFGFPQMIRFAFNPNESSRKKMEELRKEGVSSTLTELFRPISISSKEDGSHRQFQHEKEILDLLEVIDGSKEDENLLGFLDLDLIKKGKMCRHMVCVLPFKASCDALATLIIKERDKFKNLGDYEIINIAGYDDEHTYKTIDVIKRRIQDLEEQGKKTLTLTVNRMLTGTTVPEWDTMLYFKATASPQEYDQAIFRLQNQHIKSYRDKNDKVIKHNMKPQTLLVDFDPNRMFVLQEMKSQFYNVNTARQGNSKLKDRIAKELEVSPIIYLNRNQLKQATPTNITDAVREYSRSRSILDDATDLPSDSLLLQDESIAAILKTIEPIDSKNGLQIKPNEGNGDDMNTPSAKDPNSPKQKSEEGTPSTANTPDERSDTDSLRKQLAAYFARILFYAFLTESSVKSLEEIIRSIPTSANNRRIAHNLGLDVSILNLVQSKSNPFLLQKLDYKIENVNDLMRDTQLTPLRRVEVAMRKFGRMSDSEIVTPMKVADDMVRLLPEDVFQSGPILDIASKQGEFAMALLKRYGPRISKKIYSVCTSKLAYEFTRKVYNLLSLPVEHIFNDFTSYDLIKKDNDKKFIIPDSLQAMNFSTIIGNPPYQEVNEGMGNGANPLYHSFIELGRNLTPEGCMIHPARFLFRAGKTPKEWNEKILSDPYFKVVDYQVKSTDIFRQVDVKGGIAITMWNQNEAGEPIGFFSPFSEIRGILNRVKKGEFKSLADIVYPRDLYKLTNTFYKENSWAEGRQSKGHRLDIGSSIFEVFPEIFLDKVPNGHEKEYIGLYGLLGRDRVTKWIKRSYVKLPDNIDKYKVFVPKSNGTGAIGEVLSTPVIGVPVIGHTLTFLSIGCFEEAPHAEACLKYVRTRFARLLLGTLKVTQDNPKDTWSNVPMQDFTENSDIDWSKSVEEIDQQLFRKYNLSEKEIAFIESMIKPM